MTLTITVPAEVEDRLGREASALGLPLVEFAAEVLATWSPQQPSFISDPREGVMAPEYDEEDIPPGEDLGTALQGLAGTVRSSLYNGGRPSTAAEDSERMFGEILDAKREAGRA